MAHFCVIQSSKPADRDGHHMASTFYSHSRSAKLRQRQQGLDWGTRENDGIQRTA